MGVGAGQIARHRRGVAGAVLAPGVLEGLREETRVIQCWHGTTL